jgi:hypothetical protein
MTNQHSVVSSDGLDRDPKTAERALNAAIVGAEIAESFEEYLELFDAFYADDVEVMLKLTRLPSRCTTASATHALRRGRSAERPASPRSQCRS